MPPGDRAPSRRPPPPHCYLSGRQHDTSASLVVEDGRVTRVYLIRNPRKLIRLDEPADLAR